MKKIIDFFIERTLIVNLLTALIFLVGGITVYGLQKEIFQAVEFDVILVLTTYPGSSAEDVEKLVTIELERSLKGVDGIKKLNALSAEGRSILYLEVEADADIDEVLDDTKSAIDSVNTLPEDADTPSIKSLTNKERGIMKIALTGGSYSELRETSKKLRDRLERIPAISLINLEGYREDEIQIQIDPEKLKTYDISPSDIYETVKSRNINLSSGKLEMESGDIIVRTVAELQGVEEIKNLVIRSNESGANVKVSQVARVIMLPKEGSVLQRSDGERAIFLDIKIKEKADILDSSDKVKLEVDNFFAQSAPAGITYKVSDDTSYYVKRRLSILTDNGIMGLLLVFVCLTFFLNIRTSIMTSLGAPMAFMVAFVAMNWMGMTLNLISMFALILVLGMLVDDSIIVAEHFYRKMEAGEEPKEAARNAAYETIRPVLATILTTMVAFGAIFFMGGIMGRFLWPVPAVVIICLLASLFECFVILPSHLAEYCRVSNHKKHWYDRLIILYKKTLKIVLRCPWAIMITFGLLLIGSLGLARNMKFELFPGDDVRVVFVQIKGMVGNSLKMTDTAMKSLETIALQELRKDEKKQIKSQVGVLIGEHGNKLGSHYGSLVLYLTAPDERERSTDTIVKEIIKKGEAAIPEYNISVTKIQGGPPRGKDIDIELTSDSLEDLKQASKLVLLRLQKVKGVTSGEIDFEEGKQQIIIEVNQPEASRFGVSTSQIALELRRALSSDSMTEIRKSDEDIEIKMTLAEHARSQVSSIKKLMVRNQRGFRIPIERLATFKEVPGAFIIRRQDRKRIFSVSGTLNKSVTKSNEVVRLMKKELPILLKDYPQVDFAFGGEDKSTKESMMRLAKSGGFAMICIFFILVLMFSSFLYPIVVMMAIPLGFIGVIWTFFIFNTSLGFMALLGVVALVGVVVNDSIVLVNFINIKKKETEDLTEAVIEASASRFRAVILTTFTTVAGLLPVAHPIITRFLTFGRTVDSDPFLKPMAMSFAWGLLFASMVTLIFIPCNYIVLERVKNFIKKKLTKNSVDGAKDPTTA